MTTTEEIAKLRAQMTFADGWDPLAVGQARLMLDILQDLADRVEALEDPEASLRRGFRGFLGEAVDAPDTQAAFQRFVSALDSAGGPPERTPPQYFLGALADDVIGGGS